MTPRKTAPPLTLQGAVWWQAGGASLGGHGRVALLQAIADTGSITQAAKRIGMSYKAAWDAVDQMNNLAGTALVERSAGGRGGGSTRLTPRGQQLVARFAQIEAIHQRFIAQLSEQAGALNDELDLLRTLNMRTSARNSFAGRVSALRRGAVNDEVELTLPGGQPLVAIVTHESSESLGLSVGAAAFAWVQASSVIVATERSRTSARNQLVGSVERIVPGAVNAEVVITLDGGGSIAAMLTSDSVRELGLAAQVRCWALFKASSVIVGVAG
jgi:molybdate transport system regulatory protein